jgi:N-acyl-D-aspartate/D-glutamate deacylase
MQVAGQPALCEKLAEVSGRPVVWNILAAATDQHGAPTLAHAPALEWLDRVNGEQGLRIFAQALTVDVRFEFTLEEWNLFDSSPLWRDVTLGDVTQRLEKMTDPARRAALRAEFDEGRGPVAGGGTEERAVRVGSSIAELLVEWVTFDADPELRKWEGHTIAEMAAAQGKHPIDAMLDLAVATNLRTGFATPVRGTNVDAMSAIANSPYALPGVSDGGAHTKFITLGTYPTELLTKWVRTHGIMSLEDAHWRLSAYPAMAAGVLDRGHLRQGMPADLVVYDYDALDIGPSRRADDYPAGAWRLVAEASGYRHIFVNGVETFTDGVCTGATPGRLLRHGTA